MFILHINLLVQIFTNSGVSGIVTFYSLYKLRSYIQYELLKMEGNKNFCEGIDHHLSSDFYTENQFLLFQLVILTSDASG